ncbi:MAG TPA: AAA family ATPase [Candidatus Limnocylindrales bacterium]|nr:AAA family ATPase [Candidatus Limnocylindrales bacterium]
MEREEQSAKLMEAFGQACGGTSRAMLITGPVGSGKTALVRDFVDHAAAVGAQCLEAVGHPTAQVHPLGVLRQLAGMVPASKGERLRKTLPPEPERGMSEWAVMRAAHAFRDTLFDMAGSAPVVLWVDEIQHSDISSLEVLTSVFHRWGNVRVLTILTEHTGLAPKSLALHRGMPSYQDVGHLSLPMLSELGVAAVLRERLSAEPAFAAASEWFGRTGGNPLLLTALLADHGRTPGLAAVDSHYARTVMRCLYRVHSDVLRTAQVLAVVGEAATPSLVSRLLELPLECVDRAIDELTATGLVVEGHLRHDEIAAVVRANLTPDHHRELRVRTAKLLYDDGAPAAKIARLLEKVGGLQGAWAARILQEAALAETRPGEAVRYLEMALQACDDEAPDDSIIVDLIRARWRQDPVLADRKVADLATAVRGGRIAAWERPISIEYMLWSGHPAEAVKLLGNLPEADNSHGDSVRRLRPVASWLSFLYPALADQVTGLDRPGTVAELLADDTKRSRWPELSDESLPEVLTALTALTFAPRLDDAAEWCEQLLRQSSERGAPTWQAIFTGFRADIALRQEDTSLAEHLARVALATISPAGWGVLLAVPLRVLLSVLVEQGRRKEAEELLRVPLAKQAFEALPGPLFLAARGRYHLLVGDARRALADFERCGELLRDWGLDAPAVVKWRAGVSQAAHMLQDVVSPHVCADVVLHTSDLSNAELRVAELAFAGRTNREIAGMLFITVSTVEQHLTKIYKKLGITSRSQLAGLWRLGSPYRAQGRQRVAGKMTDQPHQLLA